MYLIFRQMNILNVIRYGKADLSLDRLVGTEIIIGSKEENTMSEVELPRTISQCLSGCATAFVQNGHKGFQNLWMRLIQLIKDKYRVGISFDHFKDSFILIADISGRSADQAIN